MAFFQGKSADLSLILLTAILFSLCSGFAFADDVVVRTCVTRRLVRMLMAREDPHIIEISVETPIKTYLPDELTYEADLIDKLRNPITKEFIG